MSSGIFKRVYGNPGAFLVGVLRRPAYCVDYATGYLMKKYHLTLHRAALVLSVVIVSGYFFFFMMFTESSLHACDCCREMSDVFIVNRRR